VSVRTVADFVVLLQEELGLEVCVEDVSAGFDEVPGWDSVHLLRLLTVLERETGRPISVPDVLDAPNLRYIYDLAVG
jgi:acyl carrier protein